MVMSEEGKQRIRLANLGNKYWLGKHHTEESKNKMRLSALNLQERHPRWKGNDVGYQALHRYVEKRLPKPEKCPICKKKPVCDLTNRGIYNRELKNWRWLCRRCHLISDGRMKKFLEHTTKGMHYNIGVNNGRYGTKGKYHINVGKNHPRYKHGKYVCARS